ncbi:MAG TPA: ATP-binding protein [Nitrospiria bacterium]
MSLKFLRRFQKALGFRLTWYFGLFTLTALVLFGVTYALFASYLVHEDRATVLSELAKYADEYRRGGIEAIQQEIAERIRTDARPLLVRLAGPDHATALLHLPEQWDEEFDFNALSRAGQDNLWVVIPASDPDDHEVLDIASMALPDGTLLQVGLNSEGRLDRLEPFRNTLAVALVFVVLIGLAAGAFLSLRALRPLRDLIAILRSITATGALDARAPVTGTGDELDELSRLFNTLLGKIGSLIAGMQNTLDNVAHDLRTPMTRLRGTAEMALQGDAPSSQLRDALATCIEESDRILAMLNTLMDITEAETGAMKLEIEPVKVLELVERVVDLYADVAAEKDIQITTAVPPDLSISSDRNRMLQVLANLLDNAIKYTPRGGRVEIDASLSRPHVLITVTDTGIGIPSEELPRIWDRLYRGDRSRSQHGLGLGLSLVKAIVQAHQGSVEAAHYSAHGSRFTVSLPA